MVFELSLKGSFYHFNPRLSILTRAVIAAAINFLSFIHEQISTCRDVSNE